MKKQYVLKLVVVILFAQIHLAAAGQLQSSLEEYKSQVRSLLAVAQPVAIVDYLNACLSAASEIKDLEANDPRIRDAFAALVKSRIKADDNLTPDGSEHEAVRKENEAYRNHLQPYLKAEYIALIRLQDNLLERKYFQTEIAKNANFIEGYVNGRLGLTHANHDDKEAWKDPHLGVSPWEAIFRLEPALAFSNGGQPAILGAFGLSYTFFPDLNRSVNPPSFSETFWSQYVKKSGGRLGIGAAQIDDETQLIVGLGVQVHAFSLWALYDPDDKQALLGLGMSDLSKLKKVLGWFD